jgi:hypothetical protein
VKTTLRLEAVSRSGFDARLARLEIARLTRTAGAAYLETDRDMSDAIRQLAFAGVRSTRSTLPSPQADLRPAIAVGLEPLDAPVGVIDVVELKRIALGDATGALMHRRMPWLRTSRVARDACLRVLREEDAVIGWRRIVWCSVGAMRLMRRRIRLRPVVFDGAAVDRCELKWTYVSAGALERWAFT